MTEQEFQSKYHALAHAMQTGVAYTQEMGISPDNVKHLRVGVNMALVDSGALIKLLVDKGVITQEEVWESLIAGLEDEVERYRKLLSKTGGGRD